MQPSKSLNKMIHTKRDKSARWLWHAICWHILPFTATGNNGQHLQRCPICLRELVPFIRHGLEEKKGLNQKGFIQPCCSAPLEPLTTKLLWSLLTWSSGLSWAWGSWDAGIRWSCCLMEGAMMMLASCAGLPTHLHPYQCDDQLADSLHSTVEACP